MKIKRSCAQCLLIALVTVFTAAPAFADRRWTFPPVEDAETQRVFEDIQRNFDLFDYEKVAEQSSKIASRNSGNSSGARALFWKARVASSDFESTEIYRLVADRFANSRFEVLAKLKLASFETRDNDRDRLNRYNLLGQEFGMPSLEEIRLSEDLDPLLWRASVIDPDVQVGLIDLYQRISDLTVGVESLETRLKLLTLCRGGLSQEGLAFSPFQSQYIAAESELLGLDSKLFFKEPSAPVLEIISPPNGSTVSTNSRLLVTTRTGSYRNAPIDLSQTRFLLDGQDRTTEGYFDIETSNTGNGGDFEVLTFVFSRGFSVGQHNASFYVKAQSSRSDPLTGPEEAEYVWQFTATKQPSQACSQTSGTKS